MPPQPAVTQVRLNNISSCLTVTADTLEILANGVRTPFLGTILNTTQSLLENIQAVKQNKNACTKLMEQTHKLLNAILMVHINSDTGAELPPSMLKHVGRFMEILHKIHTFVEAQQTSNKVKKFFRQSEMSTLLKDCKAGLQKELDFFEIETCSIMSDIAKYYMQPLRSVDEVTYGNLKRKFSPKEVIAKDPGEICEQRVEGKKRITGRQRETDFRAWAKHGIEEFHSQLCMARIQIESIALQTMQEQDRRQVYFHEGIGYKVGDRFTV
ncbi:hypothetical protein B0H13DRAFT_1867975 [Mycena leptocephala]|nr:hypothetical protein B0H13DRAFT_1867975 [Mycena leptocephala]